MKASVIYYPNEVKKNSKTGKIPIYVRICINRTKAENRLNVELTSDQMLKWDPLTMRISERNSAINHYLNRVDEKFSDFLILNGVSLAKYTATEIRDYVVGKRKENNPIVVDFIDNYFEIAILNNANLRPGTIKQYRRAINHFSKFVQLRNKNTISFQEIDYEFASSFKHYLVTTDMEKNKFGMGEVSAATIIKKFRTVFSEAVNQGLMQTNPFKKVKIKTKSPRKERLTIYQLKSIVALDLSEMAHLQVYRDIFLFSTFTGLSYNDAINLTWDNLEIRIDGCVKMTINRCKSDVSTECFLTSQALQIANKYKNNFNQIPLKTVFPKRSNKEINQQLKILANLASVPFKVSTHTARHSFRQLLAEAGVSDYGVIKKLMGQCWKGDVDEVYYSITESRLMQAKNTFETYLNGYL